MQVLVTTCFYLVLGMSSVQCRNWEVHGDYEYFVSDHRVNWTEAKNNCSDFGGLAEVNNTSISLFISNITKDELYWTSIEPSQNYKNISCFISWGKNVTVRLEVLCSFNASYICQRFCNASWTDWSSWSNCSSSCNADQNRTRQCISCNKTREGICDGQATEMQLCNISSCSTTPLSTTPRKMTTTQITTAVTTHIPTSTLSTTLSTTRTTSISSTTTSNYESTSPVNCPSVVGGSFAIGFFIPLLLLVPLSIKHYLLLIEVKGKWIGWPITKQKDNNQRPSDSEVRSGNRLSFHNYEDILDTAEANRESQVSTPSNQDSFETFPDYEPVTQRYENVVAPSYVNIHMLSTSQDAGTENAGVKSDGYEEPLPMPVIKSNQVQNDAVFKNAVPLRKPKPIPLKPKPSLIKLPGSNSNQAGNKPLRVGQKKGINNTEFERKESSAQNNDLKEQLELKLSKDKAGASLAGPTTAKPSQVGKSNKVGVKIALKPGKPNANISKKSSEGTEDFNVMLRNLKPVINRPKT